MAHLIYHAGDRHVPGHPALDLDVDDLEAVAFLLGGRHSDGSPIWTLEETAGKRGPDRKTLLRAMRHEAEASLDRELVTIEAHDVGDATALLGLHAPDKATAHPHPAT
jgi:hypothetical protein